MTKQEIEKAIGNGESVWVVYNTFLPYTLVMEENLTKEYSVEPYYPKEQKWALWLKNRYICDIDRVYKTKAKAEHYLHHANVTRTEQLPFLTWEEFLDNGEIEFNDVFGQECLLYHNSTEIILSRKYWVDLGYTKHYDFRKKPYELNEENFYKAYDECIRLFRGEE